MDETKHELVEGREVCPRHADGMTYVGRNCTCGFWGCACGTSLHLRIREFDRGSAEEFWEAHVIEAGAEDQLPSLEGLESALDISRMVESERRAEWQQDMAHLQAKIQRAKDRRKKNLPEKLAERKFITLEQLAASAALMAGLEGMDADHAHEEAYTFYRDLSKLEGSLQIAETTGLTRQQWADMAKGITYEGDNG